MADKNPAAGAAGRAPAADHPDKIRNVVLVGPSGSGKTTLVEQLLVAAGALTRPGRVEEGTTVSDFDEAELRQQRSVGLALAPFEVDGVKVNLVDTPGYADFVGDLRAGLRAADAALFVISAVDGVDGSTQLLWEECAAVGMPRAVVVTKLDKERADFDDVVAICQRVFGEGVLPLYLPMHADNGTVGGLIGLLSQQVSDYTSGARVERDPDSEHVPLIENARGALIEGIIAESEDETLMDRYLAGEDIDLDTLIADLETAVARGSFYPVLGSALTPVGYGTAELLELVVRGFPSPLEHPLPAVTSPDGKPREPLACDPDGPAVRRGGQDDDRPLRRPRLARAGVQRHADAPTSPCTCRATSRPTAATRTTTSTSGSARCPPRWARRSAPSRRRSPATSSRWPS